MSRDKWKYYYYAEITIEAVTPLVLASGKSGNFFDIELVRDANGLPAIPGTTIAGILRHAFQNQSDEKSANLFFGFQAKNEGHSSSLEVSWAYVHDSNNAIHKSFYPVSKIDDDPILKELYIKDNPDFKRDHVNLTEKGVAKNNGKFDRYFVPSGSRFTFSIGFWSENEKDDNWSKILNLLFSPSFRIGASGRAGYGNIKVIDIKIPKKDWFDLSEDNLESFKVCSKNLSLGNFNNEIEKKEIKLQFPLGFRIGGGSTSFLSSKHSPDILPYSERIIKWDGNVGAFESNPRITIPGSAIKGALRHRTAYHLARINKKWAVNNASADDGLADLFGFAANGNNSQNTGKAGKLLFTDLYLKESETYELSRNSIDRFTGGTLDGALFQEENVKNNTAFETCIYLDKNIDKTSNEYKAFEWALEDLQAGRLALGGGSGHGLGFNHAEEGN
ncbi:MAG: hypothetical protein K5930_01330 [Treponemataceae bacterium]|nr:hypothetical protein [Treponemataceae bacterium]